MCSVLRTRSSISSFPFPLLLPFPLSLSLSCSPSPYISWVWQAENDPSLYGLFVVYDSGAQEPLSEKQCPLMVRLKLGPSEDISKLYIMEKSDARAAQISAEVSYTVHVASLTQI